MGIRGRKAHNFKPPVFSRNYFYNHLTKKIMETIFYKSIDKEQEIFEHAYKNKLPLLLKGPTGTGKSRFVEFMAQKMGKKLYTIACHEETSSTDLIGRYILKGAETVWIDGPMTRAVKEGAFLYLDEIAEARPDIIVALHSLTDHRRSLYIDKTGETITADENFMLVATYNPGYQRVLKDLKQSTRQRFVALEFDYPSAELETRIIKMEADIDQALAEKLVKFAHMTRNLKGSGLEEGASTRLLVHAGKLISSGISPVDACHSCIAQAPTDDAEMLAAINELSSSLF